MPDENREKKYKKYHEKSKNLVKYGMFELTPEGKYKLTPKGHREAMMELINIRGHELFPEIREMMDKTFFDLTVKDLIISGLINEDEKHVFLSEKGIEYMMR
jgi:predicted transcriptional regulator